jgi:AraC family transcriptional regulator
LIYSGAEGRRRPPEALAGDGKYAALPPWQEKRITRYIEARGQAHIGVEELAAVVGLSRCYFSRAFRRSFQTSPAAFVMRVRIERVQALMARSDMPLTQIASLCGFLDQAQFSRAFKRVTGVPPSLWRRARQGEG